MTKYVVLIILLLALISCSTRIKPIQLGIDKCEHCTMTISDPKWGAELITEKGKVYKFDSIECMAAFINNLSSKTGVKINSFWTVDYAHPGEFIKANQALYLKNTEFHSPMGLDVASFKTNSDLSKFKSGNNDKDLNWNEVLHLVQTEW